MIIFRYLSKEICTALAAVTLILLLIFLSNQFVRYLGEVAAGNVALMLMLRLIAIEIPHLLGLLLPLGLFMAILLAFGRLYADNEMTVLSATGVSPGHLIRLMLPVVLFVTTIVAVLALWIGPQIMFYKNRLVAEKHVGNTLQTLLPGRFQQTSDGSRIFYIENISVDRTRMHNLFMAEQVPPKNQGAPQTWNVISASDGYQQADAATGETYVVTTQGHRYAGTPGNKDFEIIDYDKYRIRTKVQAPHVLQEEDAMPTWALWEGSRVSKRQAAELQWRLSLPLSVLLLALLAIPLSRVRPRQGKYAKFLPSLLIYIVYANMMFVGRAWVGKGTIPASLGMWVIHAALLSLIIFIFYRSEN